MIKKRTKQMLNSYLANVFLVTKRLVENPFDCYDIPWICFESTSLVLAHSLFLLSKQIQMLLTVSRSFQILNVINKMPIALHHYLQMMAVILGQGNCICSIDLIKFELNFDTQLVLRSLKKVGKSWILLKKVGKSWTFKQKNGLKTF